MCTYRIICLLGRNRLRTTTDLPPSSAARSKSYFAIQNSITSVIYDGRSVKDGPKRLTTPIDIYHPIFAKFRELCDNPSLDIQADDLKEIKQLVEISLLLTNAKETTRNPVIRQKLQKFLGGEVTSIANEDKTAADGNIWFDVGTTGKAIGLILERKNEWADCDPYKQSILSTVKAYNEMTKKVSFCQVQLYWLFNILNSMTVHFKAVARRAS